MTSASYASFVITSVQVWHNCVITLETSANYTPHHCKVSANYTPLAEFVTAADLNPDRELIIQYDGSVMERISRFVKMAPS